MLFECCELEREVCVLILTDSFTVIKIAKTNLSVIGQIVVSKTFILLIEHRIIVFDTTI